VPGASFSLQVPESSFWFGKTVTVKELRWYNSQPVLFLEGIEDRTQAESLIKAILLVQQDLDVAPSEPDAWYDQQLVGLKVYRDGKQIGTVARVEHLPAQDLLIIDYNETEIMVPFVKQLVPEVNVSENRVVITPPMGLFEDIEED
jgi:16S rRNA processing protein RimM